MKNHVCSNEGLSFRKIPFSGSNPDSKASTNFTENKSQHILTIYPVWNHFLPLLAVTPPPFPSLPLSHSSVSQLPQLPSSATSGVLALSLFFSLFFRLLCLWLTLPLLVSRMAFVFIYNLAFTQSDTHSFSQCWFREWLLYSYTIWPSPSHTHTFILLMLNGEDFVFIERFSQNFSISQLF